MNEITLKKQFVKRRSLLLTFFVLFSLFIFENICAKYWKRDFVQITRDDKNHYIIMKIGVYDYSFGPDNHRLLQYGKIEVSADKDNFKDILMEINTKKQNKSNNTTMNITKKLHGAVIELRDNVVSQQPGTRWPTNFSSDLKVIVSNSDEKASVSIGFYVGRSFKDYRYVRITGMWRVEGKYDEWIDYVVYDSNKSCKSVVKSNIPDVNTEVSEKDLVNVFKESEDIVINGVEPGANIKVYTTSGVEIRSVVSNNDVVKIKLPANQIYFVHVGESRHKVAL